MISILTQDLGVISVCASGAAKAGSPFSVSTQPMMLCDFVLSKTRDYYYLREAEAVEAFRAVQEDIERLTAAAHLFEITTDVCVDQESSKAVYPLLLYALYSLTKNDRDYRLIVCVFEWKIPELLGFSSNMGMCSCGEVSSKEYGAFSFSDCRLFCRKPSCLKNAGTYQLISPGSVDALVYIYSAPITKIFSFNITPEILDEISEVSRRYINERLEKKYSRMDLLYDQPVWHCKSDSEKT
jgi:DNA repair protein RecO (recombination protein O)